jgi:hypothetical protein
MSTATVDSDLIVDLRIPGDLFRAANPRTFSFPPIHAERHDTEFGTYFTVTAKVEGIPETFDLLHTHDADFDRVQARVAEFNADTYAGWQPLLTQFFIEQREANAAKRVELDAADAFLLDLQAGFLR